MQLYNYQDIFNKKPINCLCKKIDIFMKCLYSNSSLKLDSFYDKRMEVMVSEIIQRFSTKEIYSQ